MANLLRFVRAFVEDPAQRQAFLDDPIAAVAPMGGDLTGEDIDVALDVVRDQVTPELGALLDPLAGSTPFPGLTPRDLETPLTVAMRCLYWIDRRLAEDDSEDDSFDRRVVELTATIAPPPPPKAPSPPPPPPPPPPVADASVETPPSSIDGDNIDDDGMPLSMIDQYVPRYPGDTAPGVPEADPVVSINDDEPETDEAEAESPPKPAFDRVPKQSTDLPFASDEPDLDDEPEPDDEPDIEESVDQGLPFASDELDFDDSDTGLPFASDEPDFDDTDTGLPFASDEPEPFEPLQFDTDEPAAETPPAEPVVEATQTEQTHTFGILELVLLPDGIPEVGIAAGSLATIVGVHHEPSLHYEIEVDDDDGVPIFLGTVTPESLAPNR